MNGATTDFLALRFHFQSPLRLGRGRADLSNGLSRMGSASLKAALFAMAVRIYPVDEVLTHLLDGLRLSAMMPFGDGLDYLPAPLTGMSCDLDDAAADLSWQKKLRKVRFLSRELFERVIAGQVLEAGELHIEKGYAHLVHEARPRIVRRVGQRVAIPKPGSGADSEPFFVDQTFFGEASGHYALVQLASGAKEESLSMLKAAFRLLEDESLGGGRSVGNGAFKGSLEPWHLRHPQPGTHWCLLGDFIPDPPNWGPDCLQGGAWNLVRQGGFLAQASGLKDRRLRRKTLFSFSPGTVLRSEQAPEGICLDQRPDVMSVNHPVWRDGRSIWLPINPLSHAQS